MIDRADREGPHTKFVCSTYVGYAVWQHPYMLGHFNIALLE
jgi:hypothetical protein